MPIQPIQMQPIQQPDILGQYNKALGISNQMQEGQANAMKMQQMQMALQQMEKENAAYDIVQEVLATEPDPDKAYMLAVRKGGGLAMKAFKDLMDAKKSAMALTSEQRAQVLKAYEMIDSERNRVLSFTDEAEAAAAYQESYNKIASLYPEASQMLQPEYPGRKMLELAGNRMQQTMALLAQREATAKTGEAETKLQTAQRTMPNEQGIKPEDQAQRDFTAKQNELDRQNRIKIKNMETAAGNVTNNEDIAIDPDSNAILAQTGLSLQAFLALTGQSGSLSRDKATRAKAFAEADAWSRKHGVDTSTMGSQYKAYNATLDKNIQRMNNTKIMENELQGTIDIIKPVIKSQDLKKLRFGNVAKVWAKQEVNDPLAQQYAMHLFQLRTELAAYAAAYQGRSGNEITITDMNHADLVIKNGLDTGSVEGLSNAIKNSTEKMAAVMEQSVDFARKQVWDLFGVGANYKNKFGGQTSGPQAGTIRNGYRFKGGDPKDQKNWEAVNAAR